MPGTHSPCEGGHVRPCALGKQPAHEHAGIRVPAAAPICATPAALASLRLPTYLPTYVRCVTTWALRSSSAHAATRLQHAPTTIRLYAQDQHPLPLQGVGAHRAALVPSTACCLAALAPCPCRRDSSACRSRCLLAAATLQGARGRCCWGGRNVHQRLRACR